MEHGAWSTEVRDQESDFSVSGRRHCCLLPFPVFLWWQPCRLQEESTRHACHHRKSHDQQPRLQYQTTNTIRSHSNQHQDHTSNFKPQTSTEPVLPPGI